MKTKNTQNEKDPLVPFTTKIRKSTHKKLKQKATDNEDEIYNITDEAIKKGLPLIE